MNEMKDLLIHTIIILSPILVYQIFWGEKGESLDNKRNQRILGLLLGLSSVLSMASPMYLSSDFFYDLRNVPLIIAFFYCGFTTGLSISLVTIIYSFVLGEVGFYSELIVYALALPFYWILYKKYQKTHNPWLPISISVSIPLISVVIPYISQGSPMNQNLATFLVVYIILSGSFMAIKIYLIERIKKGIMIRHEINESNKKLKESEQKFRLIEENSFELITKRTLQGMLTYISPAAKKLLGYEPEEMIKTYDQDHIHPDDFVSIMHLYQKDKNNAISIPYTHRIKKRNGSYIWFESTNTIIYDPKTNEPLEILSISRDITTRKHAEELMVQSEKLTIAGQLAAGIAHEIRNPLTSLKGFLQLIESNHTNKNKYFEIMNSELIRIETILSELLMLAKPQATMIRKKNISVLIKEMVSFIETESNLKNVQIITPYICTTSFYCDENQIKQVLINLIKNSIEAMPNGGRIFIEAYEENNEIFIVLRDEGCGIPEDKLRRLGEPFYTTKEKGTGLGLMVSYKIIQSHDGTISVESIVGEGTIFTIRLPLKQEECLPHESR